MKLQKLIAIFVLLLLAGCMGKYIENGKSGDQINVFGVELFSAVDYRQINGVTAIEEPCLKGYERTFDALDITIGYGFNKKIRKITTRNPNTSLFGITPGTPFSEGRQKILQAGLIESVPPFTFSANGYSVTFLVDSKDSVFGLTVELLD